MVRILLAIKFGGKILGKVGELNVEILEIVKN